MHEPIFVFKLIDKRPHQPFKVQGYSGVQYAVAHYDPAHGAHTFKLSRSEIQRVGLDLARGTHTPMCNFYVVDVILPDVKLCVGGEEKKPETQEVVHEPQPAGRTEPEPEPAPAPIPKPPVEIIPGVPEDLAEALPDLDAKRFKWLWQKAEQIGARVEPTTNTKLPLIAAIRERVQELRTEAGQ